MHHVQDCAIVTVVVTAVDPKTCIQGSELVTQRKHDTELTASTLSVKHRGCIPQADNDQNEASAEPYGCSQFVHGWRKDEDKTFTLDQ